MLTLNMVLKGMAGSAALVALAATAAAAPDVTITVAKIEAGKLVISGKTAAAQTRLRLDGRSEADFNTTSGADRTFSFSLVYLPKDCIVSVQKMQEASKLDVPNELVIANCAPSAISPRGAWNLKTSYEGLDLVSHRGSSWLATRDNVNQQPGKSADWQLFAAGNSGGSADLAGASTSAGNAGASTSSAGSTPIPAAPPTGPAGGDLEGTYPNPTIRAGAVTTVKIGTRAVTTAKIDTFAVNSSRIAPGAITGDKVAAETLAAAHLAASSVGQSEIQTDAVNATEIANDSIDSGEIVDFQLSNQDVGVLFAQVNANGTLANSSGGVTVIKLAIGTYDVDFGRNVSACAPVATQGGAGVGSSVGAIIGVTDRAGNAEAFFLQTRTNTNALADRDFHLVVVC